MPDVLKGSTTCIFTHLPFRNTTFRNKERQIIYKTEFMMRYGVPRQITTNEKEEGI